MMHQSNITSEDKISASFSRYCDHCGRPFTTDAVAPHKRFCCARCRNQWHYQHNTKTKRAMISEESP